MLILTYGNPIPRTLNLSLGARDLPIIATPPPNRQPIYTTVSTSDVLESENGFIMNSKEWSGLFCPRQG
jgi:transcription-repair coupling factor (superfamily II helicase)